MKLLRLAVNILLIFFDCHAKKKKENSNSLSIALRNISRELFELNGIVRVSKFANDENTVENEILKSARDENIPFSIDLKKTSLCLEPSIVTLGTRMNSKNVEVCYNCNDDESRVYIHLNNATRSDVLEYLMMKANPMKLSYFLFEEGDFIKLLTSQRFPSKNCIKKDLIEVNRFSKQSLKWETNVFRHEMFSDYQGCNLYILRDHDTRIKSVKKMYNLSGEAFSQYFAMQRKIYEGLASNLNYNLIKQQGFSTVWRTMGIAPYFSDTTDANYNINKCVRRPHAFENLYFAVPVGEEYTAYEKLGLPFDKTVWLLIILTFVSAFTTIFVLKFVPREIRNFVIGREVATPTLNVLKSVFGFPQISVPRRNFARFLVISFILYCLIMRTCWQGKTFEFLQKDMRRPEMKSIEEMEANNFSLYIEWKYWLTESKKSLGKGVKHTYQKKFYPLFPQLNNASFKGAIEVKRDVLKFHAIATNGSFLKRILKQSFICKQVSQFCCYPECKTFDEKIQQLITGGLLDFYDRDYMEFLRPERYEHLHPKGPKVLTMKNLSAGFVVCSVPLIFAAFAFILEWLSSFVQLIMVEKIVIEFYRIKLF